mgnify:CR=1 FL=1
MEKRNGIVQILIITISCLYFNSFILAEEDLTYFLLDIKKNMSEQLPDEKILKKEFDKKCLMDDIQGEKKKSATILNALYKDIKKDLLSEGLYKDFIKKQVQLEVDEKVLVRIQNIFEKYENKYEDKIHLQNLYMVGMMVGYLINQCSEK